MSDSGSESGIDALEDLTRRFRNTDVPSEVVKLGISVPPLKDQTMYISQTETNSKLATDGPDPKKLNLFDALTSTSQVSEKEITSIPNIHPMRNTILYKYSGSHFSKGSKSGIEKLLIEQDYTEKFKTFMKSQLTQDIEAVDIVSVIRKYDKYSSEERHCLAKYLLFVMSVCQKEKLVDTIYETLLDLASRLTLELEDFLDVFNNWGIPEELLHPPYTWNESASSTKCSPEANFEVAEYNIYKVLDYIDRVMQADFPIDLEARLTIVRAVTMMWLDRRFTVSFEIYKFRNLIVSLLDGIETVAESTYGYDILSKILNFSQEHEHNQAWIIKMFLEGKTTSMKYAGRCLARQFLLRTFHRWQTPRPTLTLLELHGMLKSKFRFLIELPIYTVHVNLLVIESYVFTYDTTANDQSIIEQLAEWAIDLSTWYTRNVGQEMLDQNIITTQLNKFSLRLRSSLDDFYQPEPWEDSTEDEEMDNENEL